MAGALALSVLSVSGIAQGTWQPTLNRAPTGVGMTFLLTDGSILMHNPETPDFYKLTPDRSGSYVNGTYSQVASLPAGYGPLYYASAVLKDGRVVVIGGEYNLSGGGVWTNKGAIYDPRANRWSVLPAPPGWANVGDAQCAVLPDGRFLLAMPFDTRLAALNPTTLTWTTLNGTGKTDRFDEEGWTLMPDGSIFTVDAINAPAAERYIPSLDKWISAGASPQSLTDPGSQEIGPQVLRPDGTVFCMGATGHNAVYHAGTSLLDPGTWTAAPDFPNVGGQLDIADGPACLLPNGKVICAASPDVFNSPTHFFEFDGGTLSQVADTPNAPNIPSFVGTFLTLPTGQIMFTDFSDDVEIYTPTTGPQNAWRPTITNVPSQLTLGSSFVITGTQFNGLSQGSAYGDDSSNATNYPLVRLTMVATGHVFYCRTFNHSTMAVATGASLVSTNFTVSPTNEIGSARLEVVTNGIASAPRTVLITPLQINPISITKFEGGLVSGTLTQVLNSDNTYYTITSIPVDRTGQVASEVVTFQLNTVSLSGMLVTFESQALSAVTASVFAWDWTTSKWVYLNAFQQGTVDKVSLAQVMTGAQKYLSSTKQVKILVRAVLPYTLIHNAPAYTFKTDQVKLGTL